MGTSVKGLLKGLRYISQIFDEKEPEMQIGLPTDVKHVAHIGMDGPSAAGNQNNPSWMNEFKSSPQTQTSDDMANSIREIDLSSANTPSLEGGEQKASKAPKSKRQSSSESSSLDSSSARRNSEKGSRRQRSSCPTADSASQEGSSRSSRRRRSSNQGAESSSENPAPKHSHRRRSKGSSNGGSRDCDSLSDIPLPVLEAVEEEKA